MSKSAEPVEVVERARLRVFHAAAAADLERERRRVDRDHLVPAFLEVQRDAAGAGAHVERAAADEPHRLPLGGGPAAKRREVVGRVADVEQTVVALHHLVRGAALVGGEEQLAVGVGIDAHDLIVF